MSEKKLLYFKIKALQFRGCFSIYLNIKSSMSPHIDKLNFFLSIHFLS